MIKTLLLYIFIFFCIKADAQPNRVSTAEIAGLLPEVVLVHVDQSFYISGQTMWFKIYVLQSQTYKLQTLSKTAYAELIAPDGHPILQARIQIKHGLGDGSFLIPVDAKSGSYELRVYTNLMKENPASVFRKTITVINTNHTFDTSAFVFLSNEQREVKNGGSGSPELTHRSRGINQQAASYPLQIQLNKDIYQPRSAVNMDIISLNEDTMEAANISIAVYKLNALTQPGGFMNKEPVKTTLSYNYILRNGEVFLPESNGFIVVARARDVKGNPAKNVPLTLSVTGKLADVKQGITNEKGLAYFNFKNVFGHRRLLLKTTANFEDKVQLEILKSFMQTQKQEQLQKGIFNKELLDIVEEMHNQLEVSKTFAPANEFLPENPDSISFYGKPYATYLLDDYKRFVTMEEVLREYVREVNVRIRNKNFHLFVLNSQMRDLRKYKEVNTMMDQNDPLVLIDGVPVSVNKLMKYDPLKVRKLEVAAERYVIGRSFYDGILSFTTYKGEFEDLELEKDELVVDEEGWQYKRKFLMPDYAKLENKNSRIPDFRELLFWQPQLKVSEEQPGKISFYTGDITGDFIVVVRGVSQDGKIVEATTLFRVEE